MVSILEPPFLSFKILRTQLCATLKVSIRTFALLGPNVAAFSSLTALRNLYIYSPLLHTVDEEPNQPVRFSLPFQRQTLRFPNSANIYPAALILSLPSLEIFQVSGRFLFPVDIAKNPPLGRLFLEPGDVFDLDDCSYFSSMGYRVRMQCDRQAEKIMWVWANRVSPNVSTGMLKQARS